MGQLLDHLRDIVGGPQVLTGEQTTGYVTDWTGRYKGHALAVVRPSDSAQVAEVLLACAAAGQAIVPQGGNTGLVAGGIPLRGELVLSLARLTHLGPVDPAAGQVEAGAGVTLSQLATADPGFTFGVRIASRDSATVGGAIATNAGGVQVLRYGPMRAQLRGIEAVLSTGEVISHLAGLAKDNTGYDYPGLLAGSEGTLAVITRARLQLVPRPQQPVTVLAGLDSLPDLHQLALLAARTVPGLNAAEFFSAAGQSLLTKYAGLADPIPGSAVYLLLEADGPGALDTLANLLGDNKAVVAQTSTDRDRIWSYRERLPEAAGFLGRPLKLDVAVPASAWVRLNTEVHDAIAAVDPGAHVVLFGHVADGNTHVNIVPAAAADGRHEDAVLSLVAALGGSISAEHGIGTQKARWLHLARTAPELALFARLRRAFDPAGILNPNVLPR